MVYGFHLNTVRLITLAKELSWLLHSEIFLQMQLIPVKGQRLMLVCCSTLDLDCMTEFCRHCSIAVKEHIKTAAFAHLVRTEESG